jgi:hypothetical protein
LADRDSPRRILEAQIEDDLSGDTIDSAEEDPSEESQCGVERSGNGEPLPLYCEGKGRESEIVIPLEEHVCHKTILSSKPLVHAKQDSQSHADSEWCSDLNLMPLVSSASPVKSEEHECCAGHEEE